jgi:hypothetical protein
VPQGGGGGGDVGGGAGECNGNSRGGNNSGSGRGNNGQGGWGLRVYLFLPSPIFLLRGAILWGSIFRGKHFQNTCLIKRNHRAHNPIKTWKLHPKAWKLGFTSPRVNKH